MKGIDELFEIEAKLGRELTKLFSQVTVQMKTRM